MRGEKVTDCLSEKILALNVLNTDFLPKTLKTVLKF